MHHSNNHSGGGLVDGQRVYNCVCNYCGQTFTATAVELEQSYNNEITYSKVTSDGKIFVDTTVYFIKEWYPNSVTYSLERVDYNNVLVHTSSNSSTPNFGIAVEYTAPAEVRIYYGGYYYVQYIDTLEKAGIYSTIKYYNTIDDAWSSASSTRPDSSVFEFYHSAATGRKYRLESITSVTPAKYVDSMLGDRTCNIVIPSVWYYDESVTIENTPVANDWSIQYSDNTTSSNSFVNLETNEFYNPVTDTTYSVSDWAYDYSTRTFTGYTENGEVSVMYGDENITVVEGGNTYNYYYGNGGVSDDGSGGSGSGSDGNNSSGGTGIWNKLGELLGTLLGGLIDLITGVIDGLLDSLISLVKTTLEKLGDILNLFGSFGDALRSLWAWLPDEIITILTAGVSVVVFASVLKLFI